MSFNFKDVDSLIQQLTKSAELTKQLHQTHKSTTTIYFEKQCYETDIMKQLRLLDSLSKAKQSSIDISNTIQNLTFILPQLQDIIPKMISYLEKMKPEVKSSIKQIENVLKDPNCSNCSNAIAFISSCLIFIAHLIKLSF